MYIKRVNKSNKGRKKKYSYLHLVENIRTEKGPRQRLILNLGNLPIKQDKYKELANCIEAMLTGQTNLFSNNASIRKYATYAVEKVSHKNSFIPTDTDQSFQEPDIRSIDINSIDAYNIRSIGPEYVCHTIWRKLKIDKCLLEAHVSPHVVPLLESMVVGRAVSPGSEVHTKEWADNNSAIYELAGEPLRRSLNSFYRGSDILFECKDALESHLSSCEQDLFSLNERICFFDLTNTHFEGEMKKNPKASFGRSKQKRNDCKLLTLALVIDEDGFIKYSKLYPGNQYEAHTLSAMIGDLEKSRGTSGDKPTVVIDAGIAHEENIDYLKEKRFHYIVVNRGKSPFTKADLSGMKPIVKAKNGEIRVSIKRHKDKQSNEVYILCKSIQRERKEEGIRSRQEKLFVEQLQYARDGLKVKGRVKSYVKIVEKIGRLREKYPKASKKFDIEVITTDQEKNISKLNAVDIKWAKRKPSPDAKNLDGCYVLRSDRVDLKDEEIWHIYAMLTKIEKAFKDMKSSLGLRPNFHQLEHRGDAHMFISVLAYHIIHAIEYQLTQKGDTRGWETIRKVLSTHSRLIIECTEYDGVKAKGKNFLRICSRPEPVHVEIYRKLGLKSQPFEKKYYENL